VPPSEVTLNATVIGRPNVEGSGETLAIVVAVGAWFTVCVTGEDALLLKEASPA